MPRTYLQSTSPFWGFVNRANSHSPLLKNMIDLFVTIFTHIAILSAGHCTFSVSKSKGHTLGYDSFLGLWYRSRPSGCRHLSEENAGILSHREGASF